MSTPVFMTLGIVGGLMVLGGLTYITIGKTLNKIKQDENNYEKNLHARANLLRSRKANRTRSRPSRRTYSRTRRYSETN